MRQSDQTWIVTYIGSVEGGSAGMSQRRLSSVERYGGTTAAIAAARERGVHLVKLTDDHGDTLIAASLHPFERFADQATLGYWQTQDAAAAPTRKSFAGRCNTRYLV